MCLTKVFISTRELVFIGTMEYDMSLDTHFKQLWVIFIVYFHVICCNKDTCSNNTLSYFGFGIWKQTERSPEM